MDSMPPATTTELFPVCTACAARATAFSPEPQTLLIVMAPTAGANPPKMAACRAGFCPSPADTTLPIMHSSTCVASSSARFTASRTTIAPNCGALRSLRLPWNFPTGVRHPEMMTTSSKAAMNQAPAKISRSLNYRCARSRKVELMKDRPLDSGLICISQTERDSADLESALIAYCADNGDDGWLKTHAHRKFGLHSSLRDFGTATDCGSDFIFLLTSFFNDSIHQLVATKDRCKISMNNGRENRTNGNEEEGEKEKEALRKFCMKSNRGTQIASPKFFAAYIRRRCPTPALPD